MQPQVAWYFFNDQYRNCYFSFCCSLRLCPTGTFVSLHIQNVEIIVKSKSHCLFSSSPFLSSHAGVVYGADDFLPCLTWVLLRSEVVTLQQDTDYMMELLDPTQLQGEGTADTLILHTQITSKTHCGG